MKKILLLILAIALVSFIVACAADEAAPAADPTPAPADTPAPAETPEPEPPGEPDLADERLAALGLDENLRFLETQQISALIWDRSDERIPVFSEGYWARWIQAEILEVHNIELEWVQTPRWDQEEVMSMLLAGGDAPDVGFIFGMTTVQTFADMGGIMDLTPLLEEYRDLLPNMYDLLTVENVYWNRNPEYPHSNYAIAGRLIQDGRINTFVREDWLNTLNIAPPTTLQEFEDMLIAFRDNAEELLGADANMMVPYMITSDVGWTADHVITSFIPDNISEREWFRYGFCDRRFTQPNIKEGVRVLNRWWNDGLIMRDFAEYEAADTIYADLVRMGVVGAFTQNWDMPFRGGGDRWITDMQENVGPEANYMVVTPFPNDSGVPVFHMPAPIDRMIFFPATNQNPLASLLYLDFMSRLEVRNTLAFGIEGVHHIRHANGAIETLPQDYVDGDQIIVSLRNFDVSLMVNGVDLGDDVLSGLTIGYGYPGIDPAQVLAAREAGLTHGRWMRRVQHRPIAAEGIFGGPLNDIRDTVLNQSIVAPVDQFDAVFDAGMQNYMTAGGQAIIDERDQAWVEMFGDVPNMPD